MEFKDPYYNWNILGYCIDELHGQVIADRKECPFCFLETKTRIDEIMRTLETSRQQLASGTIMVPRGSNVVTSYSAGSAITYTGLKPTPLTNSTTYSSIISKIKTIFTGGNDS